MSADEVKNNEEELNGQSAESETQEEVVEGIDQPTGDDINEQTQEQENIEIDEQEALISQLEHEVAATKDALLRKAAELENVRKRVQRERVALFDDAKVAALQDFLPISEDIQRVIDASANYDVDAGFLDGVKLVAAKFEEAFGKYGVEAINETGIPFDVNLHDAMLRQPAPDKKTKSDTVLQILESGYKIGNKVIKHAKVIVSE